MSHLEQLLPGSKEKLKLVSIRQHFTVPAPTVINQLPISLHSLKIEKQLETLIHPIHPCAHYQHIVARTSHFHLKTNAKDHVSRHLILSINQRPPLVWIVRKPSTSAKSLLSMVLQLLSAAVAAI